MGTQVGVAERATAVGNGARARAPLPHDATAAQLAMLQRTLGNQAVGELLRRRAASQPAPARTTVQTRAAAGQAQPAHARPNPARSADTPRAVQRDPWDAAASADEQLAEQNVNPIGAPHPVSIGPVQVGAMTQGIQKHFDKDMLREVQTVMTYLPAAHVSGNPSLGRIVMEHATAQNPGVSYFGNGALHIVVPGNAGSWLYLGVSKWPVGDVVTTPLTNVGYTQTGNNPAHLSMFLGSTFNRDVVGTGTIGNKVGMIGENFVRWLLKHETGHSVDAAIGWTAGRHYRLPACAEWLIHDGTDTTELVMQQTIEDAVGMTAAAANAGNVAFAAQTGHDSFSDMIGNAIANRDENDLNVPNKRAAKQAFVAAGGVPNAIWAMDTVEDVVRAGLRSPWQLGSKGGVPLGNRTYQVEYQHARWVSYNSASYANRNSNYQFSGPDEWFAESYAHYFAHRSWKFWQAASAQWGNKLNDPAARAWFRHNLDPVNGMGALINAGALQPMGGPAPAIPAQNPVAMPGTLERVGEALKGITVTLLEVGASGLFRLLSSAFLVPLGILKYLAWVPLQFLWRTILSLLP